jgi:UDP-GlcNAc3NAcA epimerase
MSPPAPRAPAATREELMRIASVVGARPQFIKAAAVSRVLRGERGRRLDLSEYLIHTGQHYDADMSAVFFDELSIPRPDVDLGVGSGSHAFTTGQMLLGLETELLAQKPDMVLVYGDTNTTLAAALAAAKLDVPVAHVEAGLRSFNRRMPEEVNRVVADHLSRLLFCPTPTAVANLATEGIGDGVHLVGDVMYDTALFYGDLARRTSDAVERFELAGTPFALATVHRQENTDDDERLAAILAGLTTIADAAPVLLPLHPRTRARLAALGWEDRLAALHVVGPLPYLDTIALERAAAVIVTDSGGMQKEALFYGIPCVTITAAARSSAIVSR